MKKRAKLLFTASLIFLDGLMVGLAFYLAYRIWLLTIAENIVSFRQYWSTMLVQIASVLMVYFFYKLYHLQRAASRIDELYSIFAATSVGMILSFAVASFVFKNDAEADYPRRMVIYAWGLTLLLVAVGRNLLTIRDIRPPARANKIALEKLEVHVNYRAENGVK